MTSRTTAANAKTLSLSLILWVGAVATELSQKIEGARDGNGPPGPCELAAGERLGRRDGEREIAAACEEHVTRPVIVGERRPLRISEHDRASGPHDRELLGGDRLSRVAEHVHVIERNVREHDDPCAK